MRATTHRIKTAEDPAAELLELFYPVHYKGGMALEDAMRRGQLTRKQVAILWLIRVEGSRGGAWRGKRSNDCSRLGLR